MAAICSVDSQTLCPLESNISSLTLCIPFTLDVGLAMGPSGPKGVGLAVGVGVAVSVGESTKVIVTVEETVGLWVEVKVQDGVAVSVGLSVRVGE